MGGQVNYPAQKRGVVDQNGMKKAQVPEGSLGWLLRSVGSGLYLALQRIGLTP